MKPAAASRITALLRLVILLAAASASAGSAQPANSPDPGWWRDSMKGHDERIAWWREARFGMFVHWGVSSALGNEFHGRKGGGYAEHIQRVLKIPIPVYRAEVAGSFNPTNFNADEWIRTAKDAGMGYFVITAKHHDGFAMWPSRVSDYNLTNCTPFQRDPMQELKAACQKYGLRFGFYYSHAFDWGEANAPGNDWDYQNPGGDKLLGGKDWWEQRPEFLPLARRYVDNKAIPQLLELIRDYDPDTLWFDTPHKLPPAENLRILKAVRAASPRVVINSRLVRGLGDYDSTADRPAEFSPHEGDWEGIPTTNESYGWNRFDLSHKTPAHFIQLLAKAAARGGNILMNVGPMGDGRMDPKDVAILHGIGAWWRANGESIRGTTRTPLPVQVWGESTRKSNTLFLHVFDWPGNRRLVVGGLKSDVKRARLLATSHAVPLAIRRLNPLDVAIEGLPATAPDTADSVIAIDGEETVATHPARLLQPEFPTDTLRVFDAELQGRGLQFGPGKTGDAYVTGWSNLDQVIRWPVRLNQPATFEVTATYDADTRSAGDSFCVSLAGEKGAPATVNPGKFQTASLGRIPAPAGPFEVRVSALKIEGGESLRLRHLVFKLVP